jgi:hypothetical protein
VGGGFGLCSARLARPNRAIFEKEFRQEVQRTRIGFGTKVLPHSVEAKNQDNSAGRSLRCGASEW